MLNNDNGLAQKVGLIAHYLGENAMKQHMAGHGSYLVTHIFDTIEQVAERFGGNIEFKEREFMHSQSYKDGGADAKAGKPYSPIRTHGAQAVLEYGTGYLRGLVEKEGKK